MDKNPFSLYDFLGYVIPGSVALMLLWVILHSCEQELLTLKPAQSTLSQ